MRVVWNDAVEPGAIDALETIGRNGITNARDLERGQGDQIGVAVHERDAAIGHYCKNIARQQHSLSLEAARPVQDGPAGKVTSQTYQLEIREQWMRLARPEGHALIGPHYPLPIGFVEIDRRVKTFC